MRTKRRGLVRLTSFVAVAGIAVGVAGLMVAQSVGRGFEDEMRSKILASTAHITVRRTDGSEIPQHALLREKIDGVAGVTEVRPIAYMNASMVAEGSTLTENVIVRADDTGDVVPGTVTIGERIAEKFPAKASQRVMITVPGGNTALRLEQVGTFSTGIYEYDSTQIRVSRDDFARLQSVSEFVPSTLGISVSDIYRSNQIAETMRGLLGPEYKVLDWQEANRPLFSALALERRGALVVIALVLIIAAVNVTTTLSLLVTERRLDVAVLRTCGATGGTIVRMFVFEGMLIALAGTASGLLIGAAACAAVNTFGLLRLPAEVYSVSEIHLRPTTSEVAAIAAGALLLSFIASLIPAVRSAAIKPVENLTRS